MRICENILVASGDMSADITSASESLLHIFGYCVQVQWSGTSPVGTLTLEASNDGASWSTVDGSLDDVYGDSGSGIYHVTDVFYPYVRLKYTRTSGTGTLNATINLKGVG